MNTTRVNIYDTLLAQTSINHVQLKSLINFIAQNRQCRLSAAATKTLLVNKPLQSTPISMLYDRGVELHKDTKFSFMQFLNVNHAMPEIMTYTHITFDLLQIVAKMQDPSMAMILPQEMQNTLVLNTTTLMRRTGELNNTTEFQALFVRDLLTRSYYNSKNSLWLSPSLLEYMCRFYNMSMSSQIASVFNLTYQEQQIIACIFSLFFMQKVSDANTAEILIKSTKLGLGSTETISNIISGVKDTLQDKYSQMSLDDVCCAINQIGIARVNNINRKFLYTRMRNVGPDVLTSSLSLEYPAYWCYLILLVLSGRKMGLTITFKNNNLAADASRFCDMLMHTPTFFANI